MGIKEAFRLIKDDIDNLNYENFILGSEIDEIKDQLKEICLILEDLGSKIHPILDKKQDFLSTDRQTDNSTIRQINQTPSTDISTENSYFKPLNPQNSPISIGNEGVSTDKQTNRQTNRQTQNSLENVAEMLDSLDSIKKELRLKFKRLTEQELLVFSALYQIDEEQGYADYKSIAAKTSLTESSIRDYIRRLINKGIPLIKEKINNKTIKLSVSDSLKKVATLSTIIKLREI